MNSKSQRHIFSTLLLVMTLMTVEFSSAQQANPDAGFVAPRPKKVPVESTQVEKPASYDIAGIVAQAFKMKKPLQMINPLAPAKYGDGSDNVSWDPDKPEKPKGIILLGIQW